jgi:glucose/arabinose dehydrogenase
LNISKGVFRRYQIPPLRRHKTPVLAISATATANIGVSANITAAETDSATIVANIGPLVATVAAASINTATVVAHISALTANVNETETDTATATAGISLAATATVTSNQTATATANISLKLLGVGAINLVGAAGLAVSAAAVINESETATVTTSFALQTASTFVAALNAAATSGLSLTATGTITVPVQMAANGIFHLSPAIVIYVPQQSYCSAVATIGLSGNINANVLAIIPLAPITTPVTFAEQPVQSPYTASTLFDVQTPSDDAGTALACPWGLAWAAGIMLFTQRDRGTLTSVSRVGIKTTIGVPNVSTTGGDGGLMGLAVDPNYSTNNYIYMAQTVRYTGSYTTNGNAVVRYVYTNNTLSSPTVLINWDSNTTLNGGYIKFGPDGYLYITTGVAGTDSNAQNLRSNNGKILRIASDGSIPTTNPFGTAIYAFGFRNPLGLCWQMNRLWATDWGKQGYDDINLVKPGGDYGYPIATGNTATTDMYGLTTTPPALSSGPHDTWSPCGLTFFNQSIYFGCLGGTGATAHGQQALGKSSVVGNTLQGKMNYFVNQYGRIRTIELGPDGMMYFTTSNNDGIGNGVDGVYRITPP